MIEPLFHSSPAPRRRGRPPGARTQLLAQARALGLHHFAFLRAALLGVDLPDAFERYLAWSESTTDLRHVQHRRGELLNEVVAAGRRLLAAHQAAEKTSRPADPPAAGQPAPHPFQPAAGPGPQQLAGLGTPVALDANALAGGRAGPAQRQASGLVQGLGLGPTLPDARPPAPGSQAAWAQAVPAQLVGQAAPQGLPRVPPPPSGPPRPHDLLHTQLERHLEALSAPLADVRTAQLPTLDEWMAAEGLDPDAFSEAEALAEYRAAHGIDNPDAQEAAGAAGAAADPVRARIDALNYLQLLLAIPPRPSDRIDTWFARAVAVRLRNAGATTLEDLVKLINTYGHRWHNQVEGFGRVRAERVVAWLRLQQDTLHLVVRENALEPAQLGALRRGVDPGRLALPPRFALVPLEQLALPPALSGRDGAYRTHMPNTLEAEDDLQAVTRWLHKRERESTARSYRKEVERFVLWAVLERRKPVSSLSAVDCQAYRAFLAAVPAHWIHQVPVARTDPAWCPFRRQPGPASQKLALVIVQTLLEGLVDAGYLAANAMRAVMKQFRLPKTRLNVTRGFTEAEWAHVLSQLAEYPHSSARLRLRCLLELLVSTALRLDELAKARRADLQLESLPGQPDTWVLTVTGKRDKQREVPLTDDVVALLEAHGQEFAAQDAAVDDPGELPLIRTLAPSVEQWRREEDSGDLVKASRTKAPGGALSARGIYEVVKRFMTRVAKSAPAVGLSAQRFEAASTHWLRHTAVRQALADGVPIEVVAELAGHASISTTSIYARQELARKIEAVRGRKRRVATPPPPA